MVNWNNIKPDNIEYADRAFNHGIKKEEYEELFRNKISIKKFKKEGENRYRLIGKSYGKYILAIIALGKGKIRIFSGREASEEYKNMYKKEYQR